MHVNTIQKVILLTAGIELCSCFVKISLSLSTSLSLALIAVKLSFVSCNKIILKNVIIHTVINYVIVSNSKAGKYGIKHHGLPFI